MLQRIIHRLLERRHFWRYATFSEVAELYASRFMRLFALRMVAVFVAVYLYQLGYSLLSISLLFVGFFAYKALFAWPSALMIARFGPKHGTFTSNILAAISMLFLPFVPDYGWLALIGWGVFQGSSTCLYDFCYMVDFSKVKNVEHAGKEIAFMNIFEKVGVGLGPIIGGVLATSFGPTTVMIFASVIFLLSAWPLFATREPTRLGQVISFSGFPWRTTWRSIIAEGAIGFDGYATGTVWVLFITVVVLAGAKSEVYAEIGALTSVTLFIALLSSYMFGKLIDRRRGRDLLRAGTIINAGTYLLRPFVATPVGVIMANILNEVGTTGYAMAFTRGMFDTADNTGMRIAYLFLMEVVVNLGASAAALVLAALLAFFDTNTSFMIYFVVSVPIVLLIGTPRFMLYRK